MKIQTKAFQVQEHTKKEDKMYPFYLVYSLFYFFPLFFMGEHLRTLGVGWWLAMFTIYGVFVALFFMISSLRGRAKVAVLVAMLALATFGSVVSAGTAAFYAYVTFFAIFYMSRKQAVFFCMATGLAIVFAAWAFVDFAWYFVLPAVFPAVMNIFTASLEVQKRRLNYETERASHLEERERIAHDLHDATGHHLTAIALKAQLAQRQLAAGQYDKAAQELEAIVGLAAQNRAAIRNAIEGTLPDNVGQMYQQLTNLLTEQGFDVKTNGELPLFHNAYSADIVAIFTEAMANTLRHAGAKEVVISHAVTASDYQWRIANPSGARDLSREGLGLTSMAKRAQAMGGQAAFSVNTQGQAELCLTLPLSVLVN
ncbi:sensor histidine kinase [Marinagarivorans cellulosilyticus]|uniref:Two-component system, NarL family, sensor histidine kinase DesK n=1 Tax=Marinagarivorans cellulosilyticus TaxID=2721545 RepID=A0AAN2BK42_9GAMM|nr:histidine kinase [Marinagarivorans cellulosilyticus]BCD97609.1 two-component system, NarL family, sensor histidine kinase DesK [Marinagarivorans cellulosilyticus]